MLYAINVITVDFNQLILYLRYLTMAGKKIILVMINNMYYYD